MSALALMNTSQCKQQNSEWPWKKSWVAWLLFVVNTYFLWFLIQNTWAAEPAQLGSFNPLKHQLLAWDLQILHSGFNPRSHEAAEMLGLGALCKSAQCCPEVFCWCGTLSCSFGVGWAKAASQHHRKCGVATHWAQEQQWSYSLPEDLPSPAGF